MVEDPSRYGVAELDEEHRIKRFIEKPGAGTAATNLINAGIYVLNPEVFDYIPRGRAVSMEREVFPKLAEKGKLYGHVMHGLWIDIGKPEEYLQTNKIILSSMSNQQKPKNQSRFEVKNPVALDKGVTIGEKSTIGPYAILGRNVTVGNHVHISNTVIFPDAKIDDSSSIDGAIIGEGVTIGKKVKISKGCIVADQAKIRDNVSLTEEAAVCPAKEVSQNVSKSKIIC
jgi:mannose-1-phosphate guanylyltransferase